MDAAQCGNYANLLSNFLAKIRGRQRLTSTVIHTVILRILRHFLKNFWEPFLNKKACCQWDLNQGSLAWESSALTIQPSWHVNKLTTKLLFKVKFEKLKKWEILSKWCKRLWEQNVFFRLNQLFCPNANPCIKVCTHKLNFSLFDNEMTNSGVGNRA